MTKKIQCQNSEAGKIALRVKVVKAPLVDSEQLRRIVSARSRALVL
ncbi:MAG: hypothetical protein WC582_01595 [Patescibacteria group bacterium]|jgi:RecB family endonuclease NucS